MRILHTSDWHLGRSFGEFELLGLQRAFIEWLAEVVARERVELVVVSGDLYDHRNPPRGAVTLLGDALRDLREAGARVAAIAGNHDSGERVACYDGLTDLGGVLIRGGYARAAEPVTWEFSDGPLAIAAVPYLEPRLAPSELARELGDTLGQGAVAWRRNDVVLRHHLDAMRARVGGQRSLLLAHAFVVGGEVSGSEVEFSVGDSAAVPASLFEGFSYVALGHLHRPQRVGASETIRYSGSPLPYSFGETGPKAVHLVDLAEDGSAVVTSLEVPVARPVRTITGSFESLMAMDPDDGAWVRAVIESDTLVRDARVRLRERFPWLVEVALSRAAPTARGDGSAASHSVRVRSPKEVVAEFWEAALGDNADAASLALLEDVVDTVVVGEEA